MQGRAPRPPAGVRLCPLAELADRSARSFRLEARSGPLAGFVVRREGRVHGYVDRCPHAGASVARRRDHYLSRDGEWIVCSWHGAPFAPDDGLCAGGPRHGQSLDARPVAVVGEWIVTA